ncbi:MAG: hypothetical protein OHK0019_16380 [Saprospiraceae bacterium]
MALWLVVTFVQTAASQSFSEGKNLSQLQKAVFSGNEPTQYWLPQKPNLLLLEPLKPSLSTFAEGQFLPSRSSYFPRWSAEELPFFCRIEHDFAKKSTVPFKFRLGSVEYVDWLEGKSYLPIFISH